MKSDHGDGSATRSGDRPFRRDRIDWKAAAGAGVAAGVLFLALEMTLWPLLGLGSMWVPVRMIAAILLGPDVLPPPAGFHAGIVLAALLVHFSLSVLYALIYAAVRTLLFGLHRASLHELPHALFGLLIYVINFYVFTNLFPWFVEARHEISLLVHLVWGIALPWAYYVFSERH